MRLDQCDISSEMDFEQSLRAKLLLYQLIYVPALSYAHELWVVFKTMRFWIQAANMTFLHIVSGLTLRERKKLGVDLLILYIKGSSLAESLF